MRSAAAAATPAERMLLLLLAAVSIRERVCAKRLFTIRVCVRNLHIRAITRRSHVAHTHTRFII